MKPSYKELEKRVAELERKVSELEPPSLDLEQMKRIAERARVRVADMARRGGSYSKAVRG